MMIFIAYEDPSVGHVIGAYSTKINAEAAIGRWHMTAAANQDNELRVLDTPLDDEPQPAGPHPGDAAVFRFDVDGPLPGETVSRTEYERLVEQAERYQAAHRRAEDLNRSLVAELERSRDLVAELRKRDEVAGRLLEAQLALDSANSALVDANSRQHKALANVWRLPGQWSTAGPHDAAECAGHAWCQAANQLRAALAVDGLPPVVDGTVPSKAAGS